MLPDLLYIGVTLSAVFILCVARVIYIEVQRPPKSWTTFYGAATILSSNASEILGQNRVNSSRYFEPYPINHHKNLHFRSSMLRVDKDGIPLFNVNGRFYYHPVLISEFALDSHANGIVRSDRTLEAFFISCADWLRNNLKRHGKFHYWEYSFANPYSKKPSPVPWFSAMAQGQGTSVLVRAFWETGDKSFLDAARKAIRPLFYDVSEGGISTVKGRHYIFPEEYIPIKGILNGAIYAYFGIRDFYRSTEDEEAKQKADIILDSILKALPHYDTGFWSLYCVQPRYLASPHYHSLHIAQLRLLSQLRQDTELLAFAERFEMYQNRSINRTRYVLANHMRQLKEFRLHDAKTVPGRVMKMIT